MKRLLSVIFTATLISAAVSAQVPKTFSYQGVLHDDNDSPLAGPVELRFELFDAEIGGTSVWGPETHTSVALEDGVFSVILGSQTSLDAAFDQPYWLAITVDGTPMDQLVPLTAVPYALNAANSHSHDGEGSGSFIGGGSGNTATGQVATVGGGQNNTGSGQHGTISGGFNNTSSGLRSTVGGGFLNVSEGNLSTIAGGNRNSATGYAGTVSGGQLNVAGVYAAVPGGADNSAEGSYSLAAGHKAKIDATHSGTFVWADNGGAAEFASTGADQFLIRAQGGVGIGKNDPQSQLDVSGTVTADTAVVTALTMDSGAADGYVLTSDANGVASWQAASGGSSTHSHDGVGLNSFIGGGVDNTASAENASVVGGSGNIVAGAGSTIGGGSSNEASNSAIVIGGGKSNKATAQVATIGGGQANTGSGEHGTIAGGFFNTSSGQRSFVGGGFTNTASEHAATVSGGQYNNASGHGSTVPGGQRNTAGGAYSLAAGLNANANHNGTFVWADHNDGNEAAFESTGEDQFLIRALGGVGVNTNNPGDRMEIAGSATGTGLTVSGPGPRITFDEEDTGKIWQITASNSSWNFGIDNESNPGNTLVALSVGSDRNVGIGQLSATNKLDVNGNSAIGSSYAGTETAPTNGLLVEGNVGIGTSTVSSALTVNGVIESTSGGVKFADGTTQTSASGLTQDEYGNAFTTGGVIIGTDPSGALFAPISGLRVQDKVMIGGTTGLPRNDLDVNGSVAIGADYTGIGVGSNPAAPENGLLVQGKTGIGTDDPGDVLEVGGDGGDGITIANTRPVLTLDDTDANEWSVEVNNRDLRITEETQGTVLAIDDGTGHIGIGTEDPGYKLHVVGEDASDHVARIVNTAVSDDSKGLDIWLQGSGTRVDNNNDYITFRHGTDGERIGWIRGKTDSGDNGVRYASAAGDFAEYLLRLDPNEKIQAGDLVGVFGGKITRRIEGAERVMVVSDQAIMVGNLPKVEEEHLYEEVGFIGQVKTRVAGPVREGDYIVASGKDDGTGIAVRPDDLRIDQIPIVLGRAWKAKEGAGVERVNVSIGLALGQAQADAFARLDRENQKLRTEMEATRGQVAELKMQMASMQRMLAQMRADSVEEVKNSAE